MSHEPGQSAQKGCSFLARLLSLAVICCKRSVVPVRTSTILVYSALDAPILIHLPCMAHSSMDLHDRACCDVFCWMHTFKLYCADP
jgi:hypothetical protein